MLQWNARLRRAEALARQYDFATPLLEFYRPVAAFQRDLSLALPVDVLVDARGWRDGGVARALPVLVSNAPALLRLVERVGPPPLAAHAQELQRAGSSRWKALLETVVAGDARGGIEERDRFFARVLVQPYAERCQAAHPEVPVSRADADRADPASADRCRWCGARPLVGLLRQEGYGARRSLVCSLCAAEWEVPRVLCVACGETRAEQLVVYSADRFPHVRIDACDTCGHFVKAIDLTRDGLADPVVDELATVPLDLWAAKQGYRKIEPNLFAL